MKAVAACALLLFLAGCGAAPAWLTIAAPAIGWVASVNNVGVAYFKFTHDEELVCPVPLAANAACPVEKVTPTHEGPTP